MDWHQRACGVGANLLIRSRRRARSQRRSLRWLVTSSMIGRIFDAVKPSIGPLPLVHIDVSRGEVCLLILLGLHPPVLLDEILNRNTRLRLLARLYLRESTLLKGTRGECGILNVGLQLHESFFVPW